MRRPAKRDAIKDRAARLIREALAIGYTTEALCCDMAVQALCSEGVDAAIARRHVQRAWRETGITEPN